MRRCLRCRRRVTGKTSLLRNDCFSMNEEDLVEVERLAQMDSAMNAEPRVSTEVMGTTRRAAGLRSPGLEDRARADAMIWVPSKRVTGSPALEARLDRAIASILEVDGKKIGDEEVDQSADS